MAHESIAGKTALVTGAGLRLGRAIAGELARHGTNLVLHYRDSETEAAALQTELQGLGVQAWTVRADFAVREDSETLLARATEAAGEIDFLVNSASIFPPSTLQDLSFAELSTNQLVNAWVPFYLTRELAGRGGPRKVVNLLDARLGSEDPTHVAYLLSKQLLAELTRRCALAYAPEVTVNGVAPGLILPPPGKDASYLEGLTSTVPLKRHGDEHDIAQAVLYLLTATFVTGTVLYVDGGRHLMGYRDGAPSR
jgi:hypothetical protein